MPATTPNPVDILKQRLAKKAALTARVQRFADDRETGVLPQIKEESLRGLLASALVEASTTCDCDVVSAWIETQEGCISICAAAAPAAELPHKSLLASGLRGELDLFSFEHLGAQKKNRLAARCGG